MFFFLGKTAKYWGLNVLHNKRCQKNPGGNYLFAKMYMYIWKKAKLWFFFPNSLLPNFITTHSLTAFDGRLQRPPLEVVKDENDLFVIPWDQIVTAVVLLLHTLSHIISYFYPLDRHITMGQNIKKSPGKKTREIK